MLDPVLGPGAYLAGVAWLVLAGLACAVAVRAIHDRWLRGWGPVEHAVVAIVVVLALVTVSAQMLGAVRLLRPVPMLAALALTAWLVRTAARRGEPTPPMAPAQPADRPASSTPTERWVAGAAVAAVGAQWLAHTADALDRGMTHADTLWYHGPYAARFLQSGSLEDLTALGYGQSRYFPLGSELLHAVVALPFGRDLLSPLVNLAFLALALLAAATIGARWGSAALAVLGTAMVLGLPTLSGTQPGQASNDVVAASLVLASIALLARGGHTRVPVALAGVALGLAAGTKVTVLALAAPIALGIVVMMIRDNRAALVRWWAGGAIVVSVCWAVRNVVLTGTPVPFIELKLGPVCLDAVAAPSGTPSIVRSLLDGTAGGYRVGLDRGFGPLWPLILLLAAVGVAAGLRTALAPTRDRTIGVAAIAAAVGATAYLFTPYTGGLSFPFNLRYLTPSLFVAIVVLAAVIGATRPARTAVLGAFTVTLVVNLAAAHHERVDAWPTPPPSLIVVTTAMVVGASALVLSATRPRAIGPLRLAGLSALIVGGWFAQDHYLTNRYVEAGLTADRVNAAFRTVADARVEVLGTPEVYPMFGADLSNDVRDRSSQLYLDVAPPTDPCRHWRAELSGADYVVASIDGFALRRFAPEERATIFERDPAVDRVVLGTDAVYRLTGGLDPGGC